MYELRLCETQKYTPAMAHQWLNSLEQTAESIELCWYVKNGRAKLLSNKDLSMYFYGSRAHKTIVPNFIAKHWVAQACGAILPIKNYEQMNGDPSDYAFNPFDAFIPNFTRIENGFIHFELKKITSKKQRSLLKKATDASFDPFKKLDQIETQTWHKFSIKNIIGYLIRKIFRSKIINLEEKSKIIQNKFDQHMFEVTVKSNYKFNNFWENFSYPGGNFLHIKSKKTTMLLNAKELANLIQLPDASKSGAYLHTETSAHLPAPKTLHFSEEDRKRHMLVLGKTGMGKSSFLLQMLKNDLQQSRCSIIIDPHGDLSEDALNLANGLAKRIIILDPSMSEFPIAMNPMDSSNQTHPHLITSSIIEIFKSLSQNSWGPRLEYILRNAVLSLLKIPNTTLLDLPRILTQTEYLHKNMHFIDDFELERFWKEEFMQTEKKLKQEMISPILNKVGPLLSHPIARNIFGQPKSKINFDVLLQEGSMVILSLSKGKLGEDLSRMLGMVFISSLHFYLNQKGAKSTIEKREFVSLIIDEAHNFATNTFLTMLSEDRKYGLAMSLAHQYLNQFSEEIQSALLGNIGSLICFRSHPDDAKKLAPIFGISEHDLMQISSFQCYIKKIQDGQTAPVFRWDTLPINIPSYATNQNIKEACAKRFGRSRLSIEKKLISRYSVGRQLKTPQN